MSRAGRRAADDLGRTLPRYGSQEEAERALFTQRDLLLDQLRTAAAASPSFRFDFTPESLKTLEGWYFAMDERGTVATSGLSPETFERCMAMYLGEVMVRNHPAFRWVVREFPFVPGTYEIGVDRGTLAVMLTRIGEVRTRRNNRKHESIWREYRRWVS